MRDATGDAPLAALVNNVGVGDPAPFCHQPSVELARQIEVNVLGTMSVTHAFGPMLAARNGGEGGRIVMMSSLGGIVEHPFAPPTAPPSTPLRASPTACAASSCKKGSR